MSSHTALLPSSSSRSGQQQPLAVAYPLVNRSTSNVSAGSVGGASATTQATTHGGGHGGGGGGGGGSGSVVLTFPLAHQITTYLPSSQSSSALTDADSAYAAVRRACAHACAWVGRGEGDLVADADVARSRDPDDDDVDDDDRGARPLPALVAALCECASSHTDPRCRVVACRALAVVARASFGRPRSSIAGSLRSAGDRDDDADAAADDAAARLATIAVEAEDDRVAAAAAGALADLTSDAGDDAVGSELRRIAGHRPPPPETGDDEHRDAARDLARRTRSVLPRCALRLTRRVAATRDPNLVAACLPLVADAVEAARDAAPRRATAARAAPRWYETDAEGIRREVAETLVRPGLSSEGEAGGARRRRACAAAVLRTRDRVASAAAARALADAAADEEEDDGTRAIRAAAALAASRGTTRRRAETTTRVAAEIVPTLPREAREDEPARVGLWTETWLNAALDAEDDVDATPPETLRRVTSSTVAAVAAVANDVDLVDDLATAWCGAAVAVGEGVREAARPEWLRCAARTLAALSRLRVGAFGPSAADAYLCLLEDCRSKATMTATANKNVDDEMEVVREELRALCAGRLWKAFQRESKDHDDHDLPHQHFRSRLFSVSTDLYAHRLRRRNDDDNDGAQEGATVLAALLETECLRGGATSEASPLRDDDNDGDGATESVLRNVRSLETLASASASLVPAVSSALIAVRRAVNDADVARACVDAAARIGAATSDALVPRTPRANDDDDDGTCRWRRHYAPSVDPRRRWTDVRYRLRCRRVVRSLARRALRHSSRGTVNTLRDDHRDVDVARTVVPRDPFRFFDNATDPVVRCSRDGHSSLRDVLAVVSGASDPLHVALVSGTRRRPVGGARHLVLAVRATNVTPVPIDKALRLDLSATRRCDADDDDDVDRSPAAVLSRAALARDGLPPHGHLTWEIPYVEPWDHGHLDVSLSVTFKDVPVETPSHRWTRVGGETRSGSGRRDDDDDDDSLDDDDDDGSLDGPRGEGPDDDDDAVDFTFTCEPVRIDAAVALSPDDLVFDDHDGGGDAPDVDAFRCLWWSAPVRGRRTRLRRRRRREDTESFAANRGGGGLFSFASPRDDRPWRRTMERSSLTLRRRRDDDDDAPERTGWAFVAWRGRRVLCATTVRGERGVLEIRGDDVALLASFAGSRSLRKEFVADLTRERWECEENDDEEK